MHGETGNLAGLSSPELEFGKPPDERFEFFRLGGQHWPIGVRIELWREKAQEQVQVVDG